MKKNLEKCLWCILFTLIIYSIFELAFKTCGVLEKGFTFFIPFRINGIITAIGFIISLASGLVFPLWKVDKFLKTNKTNEVNNFIKSYKNDYFILLIGFAGLIPWCGNTQKFDPSWWVGLFLILLFFFVLIKKIRK